MTVPITRYVRGYRQPTRLRLSCVERMLDPLADSGVSDLVEQARAVFAADLDLRETEDRWRASRSRRAHAPEARELDVELDRELKALDDVLESVARLYEGTARAAAAERLRGALFPLGVFEVTKLPYLQQEVAVAALLRRAEDDPQLAGDARDLDLDEALGKLARLNLRYKQALLVEDRRAPTWEELRALRREGHARFCWLIVAILARSQVSEGRVVLALEEALHLVERYDRVAKRLRRQRRSSRDPDDDGDPLEGLEAASPNAGEVSDVAPDAA